MIKIELEGKEYTASDNGVDFIIPKLNSRGEDIPGDIVISEVRLIPAIASDTDKAKATMTIEKIKAARHEFPVENYGQMLEILELLLLQKGETVEIPVDPAINER